MIFRRRGIKMKKIQKWLRCILPVLLLIILLLLAVGRYLENRKAILPVEDPRETAQIYDMVETGQNLKHCALALMPVEGALGLALVITHIVNRKAGR